MAARPFAMITGALCLLLFAFHATVAAAAEPTVTATTAPPMAAANPNATRESNAGDLPGDEGGGAGGGLPARETAAVGVQRYSLGVFNPLTLRLTPNLELRTHALLFLVAPNFVLRVAHRRPGPGGRWSFTGEYGLSVPTLAMRLSQGYLFPSWDRGGGTIGWLVAPTAGVVASAGELTRRVLTLRIDVTVGIPITHSDAQPLDAPAPLNLLMDPALTGLRARAGALIDQPIGRRLRVRIYGDLYLHGRTAIAADRESIGWSNVTTRMGVGVDVAPSARGKYRITAGLAWWNSDQHAIDQATFARVRSNEFWPTLDFIWEG